MQERKRGSTCANVAQAANSLKFPAANKRGVIVVKSVGDMTGSSDKFHVAYQRDPAVPVDLRAEFFLHGFELYAPRLAVGCDLQTSGGATHRPRMRRNRPAHNLRPHTRKPGDRCFGTFQLAQHSA